MMIGGLAKKATKSLKPARGLRGPSMRGAIKGATPKGARSLNLTPAVIGSIRRSPAGVLPKAIQGMVNNKKPRNLKRI